MNDQTTLLNEISTAFWAAFAPLLLLILRQLANQLIDHWLRSGMAGAAGRLAGDILIDPQVQAAGAIALESALATATAKLAERYSGTVKRFKMTPETVRGMVSGELGKLSAATGVPVVIAPAA